MVDRKYLNHPYYFRGTQRAVNSEWKAFTDDERTKLPMIWLINPIEETFFRKDPRERLSEIRLFLLCSADFENDLTKDFREQRLWTLRRGILITKIGGRNVTDQEFAELHPVKKPETFQAKREDIDSTHLR